MKQLKKVEDLETSIRQLREEVQQFKLQREVLSVGLMSNTTVWNVAAEYFRMFRYGVRSRFLLSTMAASVMSEAGYGADALMENWSFTFGRLTITENTLHHAFPHLINDNESEERAGLARRLLGKQLVMRGAT
ncbi:uncharacterized protein PITG_18084 [Phytophthora infestans T30-4]|uniref:Uncharacterized protein n=1 Tax=Phytophthora infestans (strain T30-4) TaxID=403677 RepID=D0NY57_PHYIT|nr:uncharacterized protein PITG_18084 [Phytophthora infestans T30-4]EEY68015.1 conserved hypothetical protein [Phytophthora infestans T30-4]|eukprot:XP_002997714.1 conserved hypothetical protein [Phytophthora infestans T30-4]